MTSEHQSPSNRTTAEVESLGMKRPVPLNNSIGLARTRATRLVTLAIVFVTTAASIGATLTVTSAADAGGSCPGSSCTLRQAIATAGPGDTINFAAAITTITLTSAELLINKNLTISGPGANLLTVQRSTTGGTPAFRVFNINPNTVIATISGLTVTNGLAPGNNPGGGILNFGTLTLIRCTVSGNSTAGTGGAGGISNSGATLTLINSTISGNSSTIAGGMVNGGTMTITNSTISGNTATTNGGGGIYNFSTLNITNSAISGNSGAGGGGGIINGAGTVNVRNTIIALNTGAPGPDFSGALTSQGYNLIGNTSGATISGTTTGNQLNVSPLLGPLQNNGGPTFTHALLSGSPAIEGGHSSGSNTDQRGLARPVDSPAIPNATGGDGSDIGAYEVQADQLPGCSNINRIVNNNNDSGPDSLRAVVANVCAGSTITFAPSVTGAINLTSGELLLNKTLMISGPGANLLSVQRSAAAGNFRVFNIAPASVIATISGLTIANGISTASGGGILNPGTLTLANATISGNRARNGGGVLNTGTLTVLNSTFSGNTVSDNALNGSGGGIFTNGGTVSLSNSTVSDNTAIGPVGNPDSGGGIFSNFGTITLTNSTVSGNAGDLGGGIRNVGGTVTSRSTIIALNTSPSGPDYNGALTSDNFNLIGNNSGATITPAQFSDQIGTAAFPIDPLLGPLQDNGGSTFTRALLSGSTALDKGESSGSPSDQRGFNRPIDLPDITNASDGSDIGAFEFGGSVPPVPLVGIVSRKSHGGAGPYEIDLLAGGPVVECRTGAATNDHTVVFKFLNPLASIASVNFAGVGGISSNAIGADAHEYIVNLTGVANAQVVTVTLNNVKDSLGNSSSAVPVMMGVLLGDTNGNGSVNAGDVAQTKAQSGQSVTTANFRTDVTASNAITASDIGLVKSMAGTQLP